MLETWMFTKDQLEIFKKKLQEKKEYAKLELVETMIRK